jgi:HK97 family phage major capsid protein
MDTHAEKSFEAMRTDLDQLIGLAADAKKAQEQQWKDLSTHYSGLKASNDELNGQVKKHTDEYVAITKKLATLEEGVDVMKRELDSPIFKGGKELEDSDRKAAIEIQRRNYLQKGGDIDSFREDLGNLVDAKAYRSAARKLQKAGLETVDTIRRSFTAAEQKAFDMSGLDTGFFVPQMLGIEINCLPECWYIMDLYQHVSVTRRTFMYPRINDWGAMGSYECDAACDTNPGPEGNITFNNGQIYSFRGMFCMQKAVLQEANYDLFGFMIRSAERSLRINENAAMITGDGVNKPLGWMTQTAAGKGFQQFKTSTPGQFNPQDFRSFFMSHPVEFGKAVAVMHQNVFSYLASSVNSQGDFIFGRGDMIFGPDKVLDLIRISNCLPDATAARTKGNASAPFTAGDFLMAVGNWERAYAVAEKTPLNFQLYVGGSSKWCSKWQFDAENTGFMTCAPAARVLTVG